MWSTLSDNILAGIAALTALVGLVGACLKRKPKPRQMVYRLAGFLSAAKEREILQKSAADWQARAENEASWKDYWKAQAQQCIEQFQQEYRADAQIEDRQTGSHAGGGHASSRREDGPTQTRRLTG